jgi:hypothetical protein
MGGRSEIAARRTNGRGDPTDLFLVRGVWLPSYLPLEEAGRI